MIGNMITDMMKKRDEKGLSDEVMEGVRLHREIDRLTDSHDIFIRHKRQLYPHFSKYSPVVLDIMYDYLLESNWLKFTDESFSSFEDRVYSMLMAYRHEAPERLRPIIEKMVEDAWLRHYTNSEGLIKVFARLERKIKFPQSFSKVTEILSELEEEWLPEHEVFFNDVSSALRLPNPQNGGRY